MLLICHTQLLFLLVLSEFENCECQSGLFWSKGWRVYVYVMTGSLFAIHVNSEFGISNQINLSWLSRIWPCKHSYCVFTAVLDCSLMALLFQHHGQLFFLLNLLFQHRGQLPELVSCSAGSQFPPTTAKDVMRLLAKPTIIPHLKPVWRETMHHYGSAEQDETISQHPTVGPFWKLFWACRTMRGKLVMRRRCGVPCLEQPQCEWFPRGDRGS